MKSILMRAIVASAMLFGIMKDEVLRACVCYFPDGKVACSRPGGCCVTFGQYCACADKCS